MAPSLVEAQFFTPTKMSQKLAASDGLGVRDTSVPWFKPSIDIPEPFRELLERYSGVAPESVEDHVMKVRLQAWEVAPYPCIGGATFLQLGIGNAQCYPEVLSRVMDGDSLLDVGCCFGQDLRKLAFDGAPSTNLCGTDLHAPLMEAGYDLFLDRESFKGKFIPADFFDTTSPLEELAGKVDIIYAGSFLHLFDYQGQIDAAKRLVHLLRPRKGALIVGQQFGHVRGGSFQLGPLQSKIHKHSIETFEGMWRIVGLETGTQWRVVAALEEMQLAGFTKDGQWGDPEGRRLKFSVYRE